MPFFEIRSKEIKGGGLELFPDFVVQRSEDLMVQGRNFYAIWDAEKGLWSRDEYDVQRMVDDALNFEATKIQNETGIKCQVRYMRSFDSTSWTNFRKFISNISDNNRVLDSKLLFSNSPVKK